MCKGASLTAATRILVIDDDTRVCQLISDVAAGLGLATWHRQTPDRLLTDLADIAPQLLVLDLDLPHVDGIQLLGILGEMKVTQKILLISGTDRRTLATAERLGRENGLNMSGFLQKPFTISVLEDMLVNLVATKEPPNAKELSESIQSRDIIVHYQPKVVLNGASNYSFHSAEALVRWDHPRLGLLYPDSFIGMADESEVMQGLTDYVLSDALDRLQDWAGAGIQGAVSVNLSPRLLARESLPDEVDALLKERGIDPRCLILEITETAAMNDVAKSTEVLTRFRVKGFGLSMDDFGTGFSSLGQLYRMPFNELKIDKSFVMDIGKNPESEVIVTSILALGHSLGLKVCAEGVETASAMVKLSELGCDIYQGYHIGRPGPATDILEMFAARQNK